MPHLLEVRDLVTRFYTEDGTVHAVNGISYALDEGESLGIVGESGSGKTVGVLSLMGLIPDPPGRVERGEVFFAGNDLLKLSADRLRDIRGREIAMIFQDPMTCLSPVHTIGNQIVESIRTHYPRVAPREAREKAVELLDEVGIPKPKSHLKAYSFELSGGMRQRALMAVALAAEPDLLIADEPTTAIDVTIQAKFLDLLSRLEEERDMSVLFITHDLGVIAQVCREVIVMYLGRVVEMGSVTAIYDAPRHPYTQLLFKSIPRTDIKRKQHLAVIGGALPDAFARPRGCLFSDRCPEFMAGTCDAAVPPLLEVGENHYARCHLYAS